MKVKLPDARVTDGLNRRKAIVYAGAHYGRPHSILARPNKRVREYIVQHHDGAALFVPHCDVEEL